jgi:hypothetical protein
MKPDVAAPGDTITSALAGSGDGRAVESGTSMASPYVAGVAALVREEHPDWVPADVKAAIMDSATADVYAGRSRTGPVLGPMRVGAGRVDAAAALATTVLAADATRPDAVGVGFGVVEVPPGRPLGLRRQVKLRNLGAAPVTYRVAFEAATTMPGATISVAPPQVTVPAGGSALVDVTLAVPDPAALRRTPDPTIDLQQDGHDRQYLAGVSGRVVLTPAAGQTLRVPVAAAPKPVSALTARLDGTGQVVLGGTGVDQGDGPQAYRSYAGAFALLATSPRLPICTGQQSTGCVVNATGSGGDLRYVGAAVTADGTLGVAVVTWADLADVGTLTRPSVELDVDGDGVPDFVTELADEPGTDVLVATTRSAGGTVVDTQPVNGVDAATDTNVFDTDTWVLPVRLPAVGVDPRAAGRTVGVRVVVHGDYGAPGSSDRVVDATDGLLPVDVRALQTSAATVLSAARPGSVFPVVAGTSPLVVLGRNGAGARAVLIGRSD